MRPEPGVKDGGPRALYYPFNQKAGSWDGIPPRPYKFQIGPERGMGWHGIQRYRLAGPPETPCTFELRYFELDPGGFSSLEKHRHVHFILALRGRGKALVGFELWDLSPFDLLYVPPWTPHRWINEGKDPFGFLCPVDADRDPPQPLSPEEWNLLKENPQTAPYVF
jgi:quercetin dioxygenase-like cupin family protein